MMKLRLSFHSIFNLCRDRCEIACLQETHSVIESEYIWNVQWGGTIIYSHGSSNARGVCFLVKKELDVKIRTRYRDNAGRMLAVDFIFPDKTLSIINVYAPNSDDPAYFEGLNEVLTKLTEHKLVIGDFNLVLEIDKDRLNTLANNERSKKALLGIMENFMLNDVWRIRNPDERQYTWFKQGNVMNKGSRIDFALTTIGTVVENVTFCPGFQTDHRAVFIAIRTEQNKRGPGYWKFNNMLLQKPEYIQFMSGVIKEQIRSCQHKDLNPVDTWEQIKTTITKKNKRVQ